MLFLRKRWLLLLDIVGLIAVGSAVVYVAFGETLVESESAIWTLWGNFTTDLILIWLGVRVIDAVARWSQAWSEIRGEIRANLRYMAALAEDLTPRYYDWNLSSLRREVEWFTRSIEETRARVASLTEDEKQALRAAMARGEEAVDASAAYIHEREHASGTRLVLEALFDLHAAEATSHDHRPVHLWDFTQLRVAERDIRSLEERKTCDERELVAAIDRAVAELGKAALPPDLEHACDAYTATLRKLPPLRAVADVALEAFTIATRDVERTIREADRA